MKYYATILGLFLTISSAVHAIPVVDTATCSKLSNYHSPFILVLKKGQEIPTSIVNCLSESKVQSASLSGLGALKNPKLAYYDLAKKKYYSKDFAGIYELVSLNGNATFDDSKVTTHIHVGISNHTYRMFAGHLQTAEVGVTAEITVIPFDGKVSRKFDGDTGLNLISAASEKSSKDVLNNT